jgi:hypothetical protein
MLMPVVIVGAACASASSAAAATDISPPTITAPLGGIGPSAVGIPVIFTFTETTSTATACPTCGPSPQDGVARAYLISHLSAKGPAEIEPQKPQNLS